MLFEVLSGIMWIFSCMALWVGDTESANNMALIACFNLLVAIRLKQNEK